MRRELSDAHPSERGHQAVRQILSRRLRRAVDWALMRGGLLAGSYLGALAAWPQIRGGASDRSVGIICIYRQRNEGNVRRLLEEYRQATVALWALDGTASSLSHATVGEGPGTRLALLNHLARLVTPCDDLIVADDDVLLQGGVLERARLTALRYHFDAAQPAQSLWSHGSWHFVRQRIGIRARRTSFIEAGPLVILNRNAQIALLPFPENIDMGWGIEVGWSNAEREGKLSLGIIDSAPMLHLGTVAGEYGRQEADSYARGELRRHGFTWFADIQSVRETFGPLRSWMTQH
jgi:hypothetical protein